MITKSKRIGFMKVQLRNLWKIELGAFGEIKCNGAMSSWISSDILWLKCYNDNNNSK